MSSSSLGLIANALEKKMLRTPLWGVLDITLMERRYDIIDVVNGFVKRESFKDLGFNLRLIDYGNFVQKIPFFIENEDFINKHKLFINEEPSYQAYLAHMSKEVINYK